MPAGAVTEELYFQGSFRILPCSLIDSTNSPIVSFSAFSVSLRRLVCALSLLTPAVLAQQAHDQAPHAATQAPVEFTGAVFNEGPLRNWYHIPVSDAVPSVMALVRSAVWNGHPLVRDVSRFSFRPDACTFTVTASALSLRQEPTTQMAR